MTNTKTVVKPYILEDDKKVIKFLPKHSDNQIIDWSLYHNNKLITSKSRQAKKIRVWKRILRDNLNSCKVSRILIIGGADQVIANLALRYPSNITIVDPYSYMYLKPPFNKFFRTKDYVNKISDKDLELRKMVLLDMDLTEAIEDECLNAASFDLIIVDSYQDDLYNYSSIYTKEYPILYKTLLNKDGKLVINQLFNIVDLTLNPLDFISYPHHMIKDIKQSNKVYKAYLAKMKVYLSLEDSIRDGSNIKLDIYQNRYKVTL